VTDERTPAHPWTDRSMARRGVSEPVHAHRSEPVPVHRSVRDRTPTVNAFDSRENPEHSAHSVVLGVPRYWLWDGSPSQEASKPRTYDRRQAHASPHVRGFFSDQERQNQRVLVHFAVSPVCGRREAQGLEPPASGSLESWDHRNGPSFPAARCLAGGSHSGGLGKIPPNRVKWKPLRVVVGPQVIHRRLWIA
jgi:hypothetical protein